MKIYIYDKTYDNTHVGFLFCADPITCDYSCSSLHKTNLNKEYKYAYSQKNV